MKKILLFSILLAISSPCLAESSPLTGKQKSNEPIEINSDALEVLQAEHKAIFTGRVVAVQGQTHLKAEKMTVFYKGNNNLLGKTDATSTTETNNKPENNEKNAIEKIIVENNVFLTTPEETASGSNGIYDVENHKIYLNDNVVLTKDKNVIKGDKLVYDFATGKSTMNNPAQNTVNSSGKKGRVKALFVPEDKGKNIKK